MKSYFLRACRLALALLAFALFDGNCFGSMASRPLTASVNDRGIRTPLCLGLSVIGRSYAAVAKLGNAPALDAGGKASVWSLVGANPAGRTYYNRTMQADDAQARHDRRTDFAAALFAGMGNTVGTAERDRFDELFASEAFETSGLRSAAIGLIAKIDQFLSLNQLVRDAFNYGRRFEEAFSRICREVGIDPDAFPKIPTEGPAWISGSPSFALSPDQSAAAPIIEKRLRDWQIGIGVHPSTIGYMTGNLDVAGLAAAEWPRTADAIQAFYKALIIQSWTVFESHSEDLWEAALNAHPTTLAVLGGKGSASPSDLLAHDFEVKDKMGTILKDRQNLISFRSLEKIQAAYKLAFSEQETDIVNILQAPTL